MKRNVKLLYIVWIIVFVLLVILTYKYKSGKEFTQFTMKDGLATNTIQTIYEDNKGQIWFSTWEGISLYDGKEITDVADKEPWAK